MKIDGFLKEINGIRQSMEMSVLQDGIRRSAVTLCSMTVSPEKRLDSSQIDHIIEECRRLIQSHESARAILQKHEAKLQEISRKRL